MKYPSLDTLLEATSVTKNKVGPFQKYDHTTGMTEAQLGTMSIEGTALLYFAREMGSKAVSVGQLSRDIGLPAGLFGPLIAADRDQTPNADLTGALQSFIATSTQIAA